MTVVKGGKAVKKKLSSKAIVGALLALVLVIPIFVKSNYYLQILALAFLYSYWASCWNIIGGYAGQFALGNGVYVGIGAYAAAICMSVDITPWVGILIGILISVICAIAISSLCFRLNGTYFALSTVAFLYIARFIMVGTNSFLGFKTQGGTGMVIKWRGGWEWLQFTNKAYYYYIFLLLLIVILAISYWITRSKMGVYLAAIKTNQGAASTLGVNVVKYKMYAQCICAAFMAIGGAIYAVYLMAVDPYSVLGYDFSLNIMMYAVIGGLGTLWGPVFGASLLVIINQYLRVSMGASVASLSLVLYGVVLIAVIRFAPHGVWGLISDYMKKRKEKKLRIETKGEEMSV